MYSSDEEFPDVNEVIRGKAGTKTTTTSTTSRKGLGEATTKMDGSKSTKSVPKKEKGSVLSDIKEWKIDVVDGSEDAKPKARKRMLKQNSDNSLLKPLSMSTKKSNVEPRKASASNSSMPVPRVLEEEPKQKETSRKPRVPESDEEEDIDDSDDLSDFIVDDEEDSDVFRTPPKLTRMLVRGRRRVVESSSDTDTEDEILHQLMDRTSIKDIDTPPDLKPHVLKPPKRSEKAEIRPGTSSSFDDNGAVLRL